MTITIKLGEFEVFEVACFMFINEFNFHLSNAVVLVVAEEMYFNVARLRRISARYIIICNLNFARISNSKCFNVHITNIVNRTLEYELKVFHDATQPKVLQTKVFNTNLEVICETNVRTIGTVLLIYSDERNVYYDITIGVLFEPCAVLCCICASVVRCTYVVVGYITESNP